LNAARKRPDDLVLLRSLLDDFPAQFAAAMRTGAGTDAGNLHSLLHFISGEAPGRHIGSKMGA
jgi:hypothetical protein